MKTRNIKTMILILGVLPLALSAQTVSLEEYLDLIRTRHPFFAGEALAGDIAWKQQERFLGNEDWTATVTPSYSHNDTVDIGFASVDEFDNVRLRAGIGRPIWKTGGRLDFFYDYDFLDQEFNPSRFRLPGGNEIDLSCPGRFFRNGVSLSYTQPLLQNRGGTLSRLEYDLQGYSAEQTDLKTRENLEEFLLDQALRFMEWIRRDEELTIARKRLRLAEEELESTQKKHDAHVVEEVDLYRAKAALLEARRNVRFVESRWRAKQQELAVQGQEEALLEKSPRYDLYTLKELPLPSETVANLRRGARVIRQLSKRREQLERERKGLSDVEKPELDPPVGRFEGRGVRF